MLVGLLGRDLSNLNIPSEEDYITAYCKCRGLENAVVKEHWDFYLAFAFLRLAANLQHVFRRAMTCKLICTVNNKVSTRDLSQDFDIKDGVGGAAAAAS